MAASVPQRVTVAHIWGVLTCMNTKRSTCSASHTTPDQHARVLLSTAFPSTRSKNAWSTPDEVRIPGRLQQLKPKVCEYGRFQQLHQAIYLDQHFHSHGQVSVCSDDITGMAVGSCQEAEAQHCTCTVTPAAVQAVEEVGSCLCLCGFGQ